MSLQHGVFSDISFRAYRELPAVSNSYLSRLNHCPAAALIEQEDTPAMAFGRALHCLALEGRAEFETRYAVAPKCDKRTKAGKELFAAFCADNAGKECINCDDVEVMHAMALAILAHPFAKQLLEQGLSEQTVIWQDEETGLWCKCRPDRIPTNADGVFIDLKTTSNAAERAFQGQVNSLGYFRQAAMYMEGLFHATGSVYKHFAFIAVEKEPPYRVEVYTLDDEYMGFGYDDYHILLREEKKYRDSGFYPNYQNAGAIELYAPQYLRRGV